jgi:signal transduction histidine kinase
MTEPRRQLADLHRRLASAEEDRRADRARMHDVNSLVAGIASAFELIRELPPSDYRDGLEAMVMTELDRLQRLIAGQSRGPARRGPVQEIDLDEVLGRVALSHRSRGRRVADAHTGLRVLGNADDLAQLLDILVDNAAQHGTPDDITLSARRTDSSVEVVVSDAGPGVPDALRESLFSWGVRGPDSEGSGIGLCTAQTLAERLGGQLRLDPAVPGASFVVSLPVARTSTQPSSEDLAVA